MSCYFILLSIVYTEPTISILFLCQNYWECVTCLFGLSLFGVVGSFSSAVCDCGTPWTFPLPFFFDLNLSIIFASSISSTGLSIIFRVFRGVR